MLRLRESVTWTPEVDLYACEFGVDRSTRVTHRVDLLPNEGHAGVPRGGREQQGSGSSRRVVHGSCDITREVEHEPDERGRRLMGGPMRAPAFESFDHPAQRVVVGGERVPVEQGVEF
ncbi:hypothetical protein GCM10009692_02390 [Leucobacter aridicollis]